MSERSEVTIGHSSEMEYKAIRYQVADGIAVLTLHRPHRHNAWTGRMETEYRHALYQAEREDRVGAIVLTGEGRDFCVGADAAALDRFADGAAYDSGVREPLREPGDPEHPAHGTRHGFLLSIAKPVICAVNGAAAGMGLILACFADVRFAGENTKLTPSFSKLGLPGEFALTWILPRLIGYARASELMLSSRVVRADEAHAIGLVHAVHPAEELLDATMDYARTLIDSAAPSSLRAIKTQLSRDLFGSLPDSDAESLRLIDEMVTGEDFARGMKALGERRSPEFAARYREKPRLSEEQPRPFEQQGQP